MDLLSPAWTAWKRRAGSWPHAVRDPDRDAQRARNAGRVFEAMGHGALDAVDMPDTDAAVACRTARRCCWRKIATISRLVGDRNGSDGDCAPGTAPRRAPPIDRLIAIGASAGGPAALATMLAVLPKDFPGRASSSFSTWTSSSPPAWPSGCDSPRCPCAWPKEGDRPAAGGVFSPAPATIWS